MEKISNEEQNKKIVEITESTNNNLDPVEYFSRFLDVPEMIFQNFNGKDLIKLSEVSPTYFNFIGSSKVLMKKIKVVVKIGNPWMHPEDYNSLKNSLRQYQSIEFRRSIYSGADYFFTSDLAPLMSGRDWKNISLTDIYFRQKLDLWTFLASIESSVESLSVDIKNGMKLNDSSWHFGDYKTLQFPKLKQLELRLDSSFLSYACVEFLSDSIAIEKLVFEDADLIFWTGGLTDMLQNFDKLTSLSLKLLFTGGVVQDQLWNGFDFKLKSLTINFTVDFIRGQDLLCDFRNFLKSQSDHIEELNFYENDDKEIFDISMKMPKLRSLQLNHCWFLFNKIVPCDVSTSVTQLKLDCSYLRGYHLNSLLNLMPNVTRLSIASINQDLLQTLLEMNRKFKELQYSELKEVDRDALTEISKNIKLLSSN